MSSATVSESGAETTQMDGGYPEPDAVTSCCTPIPQNPVHNMPDKRKNNNPPDTQNAVTACKSRRLMRLDLLSRMVNTPLIFSFVFGNHKKNPEINIMIVQHATSSTIRS